MKEAVIFKRANGKVYFEGPERFLLQGFSLYLPPQLKNLKPLDLIP
jgi:hypothetical protein